MVAVESRMETAARTIKRAESTISRALSQGLQLKLAQNPLGVTRERLTLRLLRLAAAGFGQDPSSCQRKTTCSGCQGTSHSGVRLDSPEWMGDKRMRAQPLGVVSRPCLEASFDDASEMAVESSVQNVRPTLAESRRRKFSL
jgi:hypothetical protein